MSSFGASAWDDARYFGRTPLSMLGLNELQSFLLDSSRRLSAAAVLAMRAPKQQLQTLLSSPDIELRQEALKYAAYNPATQEIIASHALVKPDPADTILFNEATLVKETRRGSIEERTLSSQEDFSLRS